MSDFEDDEIGMSTIMRRLLDTAYTDADGAFGFDKLGAGKYRILLVTDDSVIPSDMKPADFEFSNAPEVISLELSERRVNLGVIEIDLTGMSY